MLFKAEILGDTPRGLTHNDVYASVVSMIAERTTLDTCSVKRHTHGQVSVYVWFEADNEIEAKTTLDYARTGVYGWSADIVNLRSK